VARPLPSFGIESKDSSVMEFQSANKAYQLTPFIGSGRLSRFTTRNVERPIFMKAIFSPGFARGLASSGCTSPSNELELRETLPEAGLQVRVCILFLPNENVAGLVTAGDD